MVRRNKSGAEAWLLRGACCSSSGGPRRATCDRHDCRARHFLCRRRTLSRGPKKARLSSQPETSAPKRPGMLLLPAAKCGAARQWCGAVNRRRRNSSRRSPATSDLHPAAVIAKSAVARRPPAPFHPGRPGAASKMAGVQSYCGAAGRRPVRFPAASRVCRVAFNVFRGVLASCTGISAPSACRSPAAPAN